MNCPKAQYVEKASGSTTLESCRAKCENEPECKSFQHVSSLNDGWCGLFTNSKETCNLEPGSREGTTWQEKITCTGKSSNPLINLIFFT